MAKLTNNPFLKGVTGMLGDFCFRTVRDETYVTKRPKSRTCRSSAQRKQQSNFSKATQYAKAQMNDAAIKALYATGINNKKTSAYLVAVSDALNAPQIHEIDTTRYDGCKGDAIMIGATDDFKVVRVMVTITDGHGNRVERGEASQSQLYPDTWKYTCKSFNRHLLNTTVAVSAFDIPENETRRESVIE